MPFADNNGVRIHFEVLGSGPPLVIQHGLTSDISGWADYVDHLKDELQLILVDARGHGASDKPNHPDAYGPIIMAGDIVAVLDHLGIEKTNYAGYSMGGMIGFALAKCHPDRLRTLIAGGATSEPVAGAQKEAIEALRAGIALGAKNGAEAYITHMTEAFGQVEPDYAERMRKKSRADFAANVHAMSGILANDVDFSEAFRALSIPKLIYIGADDEYFADFARGCAERFPDADTTVISTMTHATAPFTEEIVAIWRRFLRQAGQI